MVFYFLGQYVQCSLKLHALYPCLSLRSVGKWTRWAGFVRVEGLICEAFVCWLVGCGLIWMQHWMLRRKRTLRPRKFHWTTSSSRFFSFKPYQFPVNIGWFLWFLWKFPISVVRNVDWIVNLQAAALALKKVPEVNSTWTDEYIRQ